MRDELSNYGLIKKKHINYYIRAELSQSQLKLSSFNYRAKLARIRLSQTQTRAEP
jgi:hypothetical protein